MPSPAILFGRRPANGLAPERNLGRWWADRTPVMTLNTVVLPAPFGPMSPTRSRLADLQVQFRHRSQSAEADSATLEFKQGWHGAAASGGFGELAGGRSTEGSQAAEEALWAQEHQRDEHERINDRPVCRRVGAASRVEKYTRPRSAGTRPKRSGALRQRRTPAVLPIPPRITITTISMERWKSKPAGLM